MMILTPRLFLSYARADIDLADKLATHLESHGCTPWMDRHELLTGDDFVIGLQRELSRCDGLVLLLTDGAAKSSWCQAEVQRALALSLPILIVQRDRGAVLSEAVERLLRDVQRAEWYGAGEPAVGRHVHRARRRRFVRRLQRIGLAAIPTTAIVLATLWAVASLNERFLERTRSEVEDDIRTATAMWSGAEVRARLAELPSDAILAQRLSGIAADPSATPIARLNAWQGVDALREAWSREWRAYVPNVDWSGGRLSGSLWTNTTYGSGSIQDLMADRVKIAGIVLGGGPVDEKSGLSLVDVRIRDSDAWFLRVDGTQLIDVEFANTKFRGAQLDLSGAAGVRFISRSESSDFITNEVGIIEDSWIVQRRALPGPDVIDLGKPGQEILFDGIQFERVRFEGQFKPKWFQNSVFRDCSFPPGLAEALMSEPGNTIETSGTFVETHRQ